MSHHPVKARECIGVVKASLTLLDGKISNKYSRWHFVIDIKVGGLLICVQFQYDVILQKSALLNVQRADLL